MTSDTRFRLNSPARPPSTAAIESVTSLIGDAVYLAAEHPAQPIKDMVEPLAPLRDRSFFERVYIDHGAVAWPGEIDLAPDAMYEQVSEQGKPTPAV